MVPKQSVGYSTALGPAIATTSPFLIPIFLRYEIQRAMRSLSCPYVISRSDKSHFWNSFPEFQFNNSCNNIHSCVCSISKFFLNHFTNKMNICYFAIFIVSSDILSIVLVCTPQLMFQELYLFYHISIVWIPSQKSTMMSQTLGYCISHKRPRNYSIIIYNSLSVIRLIRLKREVTSNQFKALT